MLSAQQRVMHGRLKPGFHYRGNFVNLPCLQVLKKTCLEESTIELICGFVWSSLIPVGLTLLLQFNGMFTRKNKRE